MDGQYALLCPDSAGNRYRNTQRAVSEYQDYLDMCDKLGYDLSNSFVLWPKDLRDAHDRAQGHVKAEADVKLRWDFDAAMRAITGHLDFEAGGMRIVLSGSATTNPSRSS